jgi:Periplasmic protein TonB, links inner and outer membranes
LPKPEPKPEPPEAVVEPPPPPKPEPPEPLKKLKPEKKPPPPDQMLAVLKTVEKLKEKRQEQPAEVTTPTQQRQPPREFDATAPITISQIDAIRRHFEKCWSIPAGARDAENLMVDIKVALGPDASVIRADIVDRSRLQTDPFFRAAAESALRAVLHPLCKSLKDINLRSDQYNQWKDMTISFDPRQMFGT